MKIVKALRISVALPLVIAPVWLDDMLYVDASLFNNFPIDYFAENTLSLLVESSELSPTTPKDINLLGYMKLIMDATYERLNSKDPKHVVSPSNKIVSILMDDGKGMFDLNTLKLHMDNSVLDEYIARGYECLAQAKH
jgi:predicted acylesterase/phospholipase RssA